MSTKLPEVDAPAPASEDGADPSVDESNTEPKVELAWYQDKKLIAFLEMVQKLIVIFGVPIAIYAFVAEKNKERAEREWIAYEKMDERYWAYEQLCMDYPQLNVSDAGASDPALAKLMKPRDELTSDERIRERQLMFMLIAMYERAYILYSDQTTEFKKRQWSGWENGLKRWVTEPQFREAGKQLGEDFDTQCQSFIAPMLDAKSNHGGSELRPVDAD